MYPPSKREGLISFSIDQARVTYGSGRPAITFILRQELHDGGVPEPFVIPAQVRTEKGVEHHNIHVTNQTHAIRMQLESAPLEMALDPDYRLMRKLMPAEYPPVFSRLMNSEKRLVIVSPAERHIYEPLIDRCLEKGFVYKADTDVSETDIRQSALLLLGVNTVYKRLFGVGVADHRSLPPDTPGVRLSVRENPVNPAAVAAFVYASDAVAAAAATHTLFHCGQYTNMLLANGRVVTADTDPADRGIRVDFRHSVRGIRPAEALSFDTILQAVMDAPVLYIGESHTHYEDHTVQLAIVRALHEAGRKVAIGMEMFQQPFQKILDAYVAGRISERDFLKKTGYFSRWRFDYHLYREIVNYAREYNIPVIALNIDGDITRTVARGGLAALTEDQRKQIPGDMNMDDSAYAERLRTIYNQHPHAGIGGGDFQHFYQAQIIWDETMAHAVAAFQRRRPEYQMVVLAGVGHLMYGSGIPSRVRRLTGITGKIILNAGNIASLDPDVADYVLYPDPLPAPGSPEIGVQLAHADTGVRIVRIVPGSPAERAGLAEQDIIFQMDDLPISTMDDVRIALFDRKPGDRIRLHVHRDAFLFGKTDETVPVVIAPPN